MIIIGSLSGENKFHLESWIFRPVDIHLQISRYNLKFKMTNIISKDKYNGHENQNEDEKGSKAT